MNYQQQGAAEEAVTAPDTQLTRDLSEAYLLMQKLFRRWLAISWWMMMSVTPFDLVSLIRHLLTLAHALCPLTF